MKSPRRSAVAAVAITGALAAPSASLAASATATGTVSGSTLSLSTAAAPTFTANLDNGDSTPTFTIPLITQDTRGTGAGWNETITSTTYSTGALGNTLANNASTITGIVAASGSGTNTSPTNAITYPVAVPAGSTAPAAVKLFSAAANTGMGKFTITPTVSVAVPQNTFAGTYTSTMTVAIVSGP